MSVHDLVIFDTSTLPEYYSDVHKIIALPRDYVVTYDYSIRHITKDADAIFDGFITAKPTSEIRVILAYVQPETYKKGDGSDSAEAPHPGIDPDRSVSRWFRSVGQVQSELRCLGLPSAT